MPPKMLNSLKEVIARYGSQESSPLHYESALLYDSTPLWILLLRDLTLLPKKIQSGIEPPHSK
jgi:hypothetical protein